MTSVNEFLKQKTTGVEEEQNNHHLSVFSSVQLAFY